MSARHTKRVAAASVVLVIATAYAFLNLQRWRSAQRVSRQVRREEKCHRVFGWHPVIAWRDRSWANRLAVVLVPAMIAVMAVSFHRFGLNIGGSMATIVSIDILWLGVVAVALEQLNRDAVQRLSGLNEPSNHHAMVRERSE